jgi:hypothetical protein
LHGGRVPSFPKNDVPSRKAQAPQLFNPISRSIS